MPSQTEEHHLDAERIVAVLARHHVEYLVVGAVAAQLHGASRPTHDLDCVASTTADNLDRLAAALRELDARPRVHGLTDDEARQLPLPLDGDMLSRMETSTWRTDAGDLDVLTHLPDRHGQRLDYDDLTARSTNATIEGITVRVAALDDVIGSKEWVGRPKDLSALAELYEIRDSERRPMEWPGLDL
ncbi:hypothetical protein BH18ACT4_BH18ACT4_04400 [soil metagenome]